MSKRFPNAYVINVMADDHPGIVSSVSSVIESLSGNIDGCSQTVLGGYFTLIMLVGLPEAIEPDVLSEMIHQVNPDFQVSVRQMKDKNVPPSTQDSDSFVITVFGKDKPSIVRKFSAYLADREINIVDLYGARFSQNWHIWAKSLGLQSNCSSKTSFWQPISFAFPKIKDI